MRAKHPTATLTQQSGRESVYEIDWPSTPCKQGKTYTAIVSPGSGEIHLFTHARHIAVSDNVRMRILPAVKSAIERARK